MNEIIKKYEDDYDAKVYYYLDTEDYLLGKIIKILKKLKGSNYNKWKMK